MTPHIGAKKGEIAETVLMPGDPLRAKFIAENFLTNAKLYNNIRGMLGYTGEYKGKKVSVQGSGMGMPSIGIYSYELYNVYDVKNIIRIGTAGGFSGALKVKDIVIAMGACTNSNYAAQYGLPGPFAPIASFSLFEKAILSAKGLGLEFRAGNVLSSDTFYDADPESAEKWQRMGVLCVEMEAAALYMNAAKLNKNALAILTISDMVFTGESASPEERQNSFTNMMELALETAITE
ncbi:MAG: purine-nucleoside phosphorylase [Clostridiales bacterium]|jgi:purine-nucleoside phosphorylase|nr:purine-nucleoside phosphorylase [Clostridiales bacterium]